MMNFGHMEWFEALPLPVVSYSYGGFITFREDLSSEHYFCSCMKEAIANYFELYKHYSELFPKGITGNEALNDWYFPVPFLEALKNEALETEDPAISIRFKENLCHRCLKATPMRTFRNQLRMPKFKKWYGWYLIIGYLEAGVLPETFVYLDHHLQGALAEELHFTYTDLWEDLYRYEEIEHLDEGSLKSWLETLDQNYTPGFQRIVDRQFPENFRNAVHKALESRYSRVHRVIENRIRKAFGKRRMGGQWQQENQLFAMIKDKYPAYKIIQHYRPKILEGLELDIYIKELNLGIEYQGVQHYQAMEHLGGQRALEKTMERDLLKRTRCDELGIRMIYFYYDETLTKALVDERLEHIKEDVFIDDNTYETKDHHVMGLLKMAEDADES